MIYDLGPRALRVYEALRERMQRGELPPGSKLPAHTALAEEFNVAPVTVRQVLARLEEEGMLSREHGRGTFVRETTTPRVLIVDDELPLRAVLGDYVSRAGYRPIAVESAAEGLRALETEHAIALVLSDVRIPDAAAGIAFIRAVRRRWPEVPLAAVTAYPDDLEPLHGTADHPVLIVTKPFRAPQVLEVLRLAVRASTLARPR